LAVVVTALGADKPPGLSLLEISENRRFIITESGEHFFWLGNTAWGLFHRLNREEAERYLTKRSEQGFTMIQAVVLAELDGPNTPNAYGHRPFLTRIADQALEQSGQDEGIGRVQATRDGTFVEHDATYIMVYIPGHRKVIIDTGCLPASERRGWWFDPTSGKTQALGEFQNQPNLSFKTPERQDSSDWILVLDDTSRKDASPGSEIYVGL